MKKDKVIVDTSIWIEFFRNPLSREKKEVDSLLEDNQVFLVGIILAELLQGTKNQKEFELLKSALGALTFCEVTYKTWVKTGEISYQLRRKGITIPLSDCLIAALAFQNNCHVYTSDPHFRKIENLQFYIAKK